MGYACTCTSIEVLSVVSARPLPLATTSMITSHGLASAIGSVAELARSESHETLLVSQRAHRGVLENSAGGCVGWSGVWDGAG